jgi:serine/threonine-protein kinase
MSEEIALDAVGQRYRLKGELGRGGMSVVYEGLDPRIGRQVAIKLLHPHLAAREDARRRFLQEAKAIARLENPNILKVYDYDSPNGSASYIVSEFIDGITFKAWCE